MDNLLNKYLFIFTTTKAIIAHPFAFGDTIRDTLDDSKRAARYLAEGAVFCVAMYQLLIAGQGADDLLSKLPFAGEIVGGILIASVALTGLITHPVARFFSGNTKSVHGSIACFLYWTGFCLFVMFPVIVAVILGSLGLFESLNLPAKWTTAIMMAVLVPFILVYYVGTISSWIGRVYGFEPFMAGVAIMFSYTLASMVGFMLAAILSSVF